MGRAISVSCVALPFRGFCSSSLMFPLRLMVASLLTSVQSEQSKAGSSRELTGNRTFQLRKYRGADKSLARPGRKQARKHVRDARDFNNIETRAVIKVFFYARQDAEGNSGQSEKKSLACFLAGRAKDLSEPM